MAVVVGRLRLQDPKLFLYKVLFVFCLTYSLLPLIWFKSRLPAAAYAGGLVLLHVAVLAVYLYKVAVRQLDPSWHSTAGRALGLGLSIWLLLIVSSWADSNVTSVAVFALQLAVLCTVHTAILAFLMVKVDPPAGPQGAEYDPQQALLSQQLEQAEAAAAADEGPEEPSTPDSTPVRSPFH